MVVIVGAYHEVVAVWVPDPKMDSLGLKNFMQSTAFISGYQSTWYFKSFFYKLFCLFSLDLFSYP